MFRLLGLLFWCVGAIAQSGSDVQVPDITVYGEKSSTLDFVPAVSELSGTRLERKKQSTLGETLSRETGVTSSQFGPNASRPIIRGMEGDRIRILQNGTGVLDASGASNDHAVAMDPLAVERIEIVRGPAALLYGSTAVGGVVNMITNRIPEKVPEKFNAKADAKFGSNDLNRAGALGVDTALNPKWAVHGDGSIRAADDYHGPNGDRIRNSFNRTTSETLGTSYVYERGFIGTSFSNYNSTYGTVAESSVHIEMMQQRWDVAGELRDLGFIKAVRAKNSFSHYRHKEMEDDVEGTRFKNDGDEARIDFAHKPVAGFGGVFGLQYDTFDFSAKGEEAILPPTENEKSAVFLFEELAQGKFKPSFGARVESARVQSKDDAVFGSGQEKSYTGLSASLGAQYQVHPQHALVLSAAYTERPPNYQELFANGRHPATGIFEVGDTDLNKERSQSVEASWRIKKDEVQGSIGMFLQDFKDFVALEPTGTTDADPDEPFDIYNYRSLDARLWGFEGETRRKLPNLLPGGVVELELKVDWVRGINRSTGNDLPRMTPMRESIGLIYKGGTFQADVQLERSERQTHLAPNETETDDYTLLHLGAERPVRISGISCSLYGRVMNVFDAPARNHVSLIKDIAPLPGRNFIAGLSATF
jgi:iron complex outermembrane recepter protein